MTEDEFEVVDELYFVQSYADIKKELHWEDEKLLGILQSLVEKKWVKCLLSPEEEVFEDCDVWNNGENYFYLATKEGLMIHNTS